MVHSESVVLYAASAAAATLWQPPEEIIVSNHAGWLVVSGWRAVAAITTSTYCTGWMERLLEVHVELEQRAASPMMRKHALLVASGNLRSGWGAPLLLLNWAEEPLHV